jgi:ABC-type transporter MlaC component
MLIGGALPGTGLSAAPRTVLTVAQEKGDPAEPKLRELTAVERKTVSGVIEAQLKAFRADDYKTAEKYQSSSLKENFDSTEEFRAMMRRGYPQVVNYKSVSFSEARCDEKAEQVQIRVSITGKDGVVVKLVYVMLKEEGQYKVISVFGGGAVKSEPRDVA